MTGSRTLISDNHRINNDAGTYRFYAKLASRSEAAGNPSTAEALWLKAMKVAVKPINREWADRRAAMCKQLATKWKFTS